LFLLAYFVCVNLFETGADEAWLAATGAAVWQIF